MPSYKPSRKRLFVAILVIILLAAMSFFLLVNAVFPNPYFSAFPRPFVSRAWKETDTSAWPSDKTRCAMLADLKFRVGIVGKTRRDVVRLLGQPAGSYDEPPSEYWYLCPSFLDFYILNVRWWDGKAVSADIRDT